jgi:hypothetical protein
MEFAEHMMVFVGIIAAFAAGLIVLACIAIGAVRSAPERNAVSGEVLRIPASSTSAGQGAV